MTPAVKKATTKKKEAVSGTALKTRVEDAYHIFQHPIVNEKSTLIAEQGKLVFMVRPDATKVQIKKAAESLFDIKVKAVNTINQQGKIKRFRASLGKRKDYKKAIITLEKGSNTELLQGVKS